MSAYRAFRPGRKRDRRADDPLSGLSLAQRDALQEGALSLLAFFDDGVRSMRRPSLTLCVNADMRALLARGLFEPIGDGECVRLTNAGRRAAALSATRRQTFARYLESERARLIEGRILAEQAGSAAPNANDFQRRRKAHESDRLDRRALPRPNFRQ